MKTLKFVFASFFAVAFGAGLFAFHAPAEPENPVIRGAGQYRYTETSDDISDLRLPGHWVPVSPQDEQCSDANEIPCYVNYTGTDFDAFLSTADLPNLMEIAVETKEVIE